MIELIIIWLVNTAPITDVPNSNQVLAMVSGEAEVVPFTEVLKVNTHFGMSLLVFIYICFMYLLLFRLSLPAEMWKIG